MNEPTPEQLAKLPKWAQEHITTLSREVLMWKDATTRFATEQPESPVYVDDWLLTPPMKRYVPLNHGRLIVCHAGVEMSILLANDKDPSRYFGIEVTYSNKGRHTASEVGFMPKSHGQFQLVTKDNMR